jgi:hypothetical protein
MEPDFWETTWARVLRAERSNAAKPVLCMGEVGQRSETT